MVMMPVKTKFRKIQKGHRSGLSKGGNFLEFGEYGMQALQRGWITNSQLEACRIAISRYLNRRGETWIKIFPHKSVTEKPAETRMGKGKGGVAYWVAVVRPGRVLFEIAGVSRDEARAALRRAGAKLGIRTRFVERMERV